MTNDKVPQTLEELQAAQASAEKALADARATTEQAQKDLRAKEREAKKEVEAKAYAAKKAADMVEYKAHAKKIIAALKEEGIHATIGEPKSYNNYPVFEVEGWNNSPIKFDSVMGGSTWHSTVRSYRIEVGSYDNKKRFPLRKDGTFNYKLIAKRLREHGMAMDAQGLRDAAKRKKITASQQIASRLQIKFNPNDNHYGTRYYFGYARVEAIADADRVQLQINKAQYTEEQATRILALLKEIDAEKELANEVARQARTVE